MINILYTGNEKVFDGLLSSVSSIVSKTNSPIHVYVMSMDLSHINEKYTSITSEQVEFIEKVLKRKNSESKATLIDVTSLYLKEFSKNVNKNTQYTPYSYIRLLADLIDLPDKLLYLDIDIMATKNIDELYNIDISNYEYAAVLDYLGKVFIRYNYTNSGVMLLNMAKMRETKLFTKARKMMTTKRMLLPDQSAIYKCTTKKLIIARKYNEQKKLKKDSVLRHFCKSLRLLPVPHLINIKQWNIYGVHKVLKCKHFDSDFAEYLYLKKCYENKLKEF